MQRLGKKIIYVIFTLFLTLFIVSSFFIRAKYNYLYYGDTPVLVKQRFGTFILSIFLITLLSLILYRVFLKLNKFRKSVVVPTVLFISFVIQVVIIFSFARLPTDDSKIVLTIALDMLYKNDYSSLSAPGYIHMFPFNLSTVVYLKTLLALFPDNYLIIKLFNIFFSLVTSLMIYLIYKEINYRSKEHDYGVLVFGATYLPALFMSNFIYNDSIATAFFTSAIYFSIKFVKEGHIRYIVISSILLAIGNYFRSLGLIILIAFIIYFLLNANKLGIQRVILSICIILLMISVPGCTQNAVLKSKNLISEPLGKNSAPVHMWLNMGLNIDRFGFWDNYESYKIYWYKGQFNKEMSAQLFKEEIKNKLGNATYRQLIVMYYRKLIWTWTEGTYQVERYGLGVDPSKAKPELKKYILGGYCYKTFFTELFSRGSIYKRGMTWGLYILNFLMYCCILVRTIIEVRNNKFGELLLVLVILGFIAFYLLWEIKSRYIYPVYPILIVLSYMGFKDIFDSFSKKKLIRCGLLLGRIK